jgi:hypothetical protein
MGTGISSEIMGEGIIEGENKWRSNTQLQKQRNQVLFIVKRNEKIEFVKWAKKFHEEPLGYNKLCEGNYPFPENGMAKILALGYISDISEVKRLEHEDNINIKWNNIPFGIKHSEWDDPDSIEESLIDKSNNCDSDSDSDLQPDHIDCPEIGVNMNNLLEEVADSEDEEVADSEDEYENGEYEINSLVSELALMFINVDKKYSVEQDDLD